MDVNPDLTAAMANQQLKLIVGWLETESSSLFATQDVERYAQVNALTDTPIPGRFLKTMYENPMSLGRLVVAAKREKTAHGLGLVVVDLVDTIDPGGTFASVDARTEAVIRLLQALAREVDVTVMATRTTGVPELIEAGETDLAAEKITLDI